MPLVVPWVGLGTRAAPEGYGFDVLVLLYRAEEEAWVMVLLIKFRPGPASPTSKPRVDGRNRSMALTKGCRLPVACACTICKPRAVNSPVGCSSHVSYDTVHTSSLRSRGSFTSPYFRDPYLHPSPIEYATRIATFGPRAGRYLSTTRPHWAGLGSEPSSCSTKPWPRYGRQFLGLACSSQKNSGKSRQEQLAYGQLPLV